MTYLDYLEKKVLLERLVIGLEEPVLVKGLGELQAKIDSGNGGYNVIHGTDLHQQGNQLTFTTKDKFDHETKMTATVVDDIDVNMGGGNIEKRPVIELDIKFANEDYKKIPFSVSDRSTNTHPILISKGFVENELKALIDVGATNISNDGIDVVYGEGFGNFVKAPVALANKIVNNRVTKGMGSAINKLGNFGDWLAGDADADSWKPTMFKLTKKDKGIANQIAKSSEIIEQDQGDVKSKLNSTTITRKVAKDPKLNKTTNYIDEINSNKKSISDLPVCLVTSYMMSKGDVKDKQYIKGLEQDRDAIKGWIDSSKEQVQAEKENREKGKQGQTQEQEETPDNVNDTVTPNVQPTENPTTPQDNDSQIENNTPTQEGQQQDNFEEVTTFFEQLCQFALWFVSFEKIKNNVKYEADFKKYIQSGKFDNILYKMFQSGEISPQTIEPQVKKLASLFQNDGKQGFFVLRWTPQSQSELKDEMKDIKRQTHFYEDLQYVAYDKSGSSTPKMDELEKQIKKQNPDQEPETQDIDDNGQDN